MKAILKLMLLIFCGALVGYFFFPGQKEKKIVQFKKEFRNPANSDKSGEFNLDTTEFNFEDTEPEILMSDFDLIPIDEGEFSPLMVLSLGPYKMREGNKIVDPCQRYEVVQLNFEALNAASAGEVIKIRVESDCGSLIDSDFDEIQVPVWSSAWVSEFREADPNIIEKNFSDLKVKIAGVNIPMDYFPEQWILKSIRLEDQDGEVADIFVQLEDIQKKNESFDGFILQTLLVQ